MAIFGVDPGLAGGVSALYDDGKPLLSIAMPTRHGHRGRMLVDVKAIWDVLERVDEEVEQISLVVVEDVHSMPSDGVAAAFGFGRTVGRTEAVVELLDYPFVCVTPQAWKGEILGGTDKSKQAAIGYVQGRYPTVSLLATARSRVPHDGKAEALCLAEYGWRVHGRGKQAVK